MSLPSSTYRTSYHSAASWLGHHLSSDTVQATAAAFGTKAVGSYYRIKDDKDSPPEVRKSTIKREGLLLGMTLALTPFVEKAFNKHIVPQLHKVMTIAPYRKLMMVPPIMLTLATAETLVRLIYPKPHRNFSSDNSGQLQSKPSHSRKRENDMMTSVPAYQFQGAHKPTTSPFKTHPSSHKTADSAFMKDLHKFAAMDTFQKSSL
jgi:hypothetical protein